MDARLLQEAARIANGVLLGCVVGHEWHVADDQRVRRAADDRTRVADHVLHRYAQCVGIAQHRVAQAVTNQQHRDAGAVEPARARVVVAGEHRELLAFGLPLAQVADGGRHAAASLLGLRSLVRSASSWYRRCSSGSRFNAAMWRSMVPSSPREAGPVMASAGDRSRRLLTAPASRVVRPWRAVSESRPASAASAIASARRVTG